MVDAHGRAPLAHRGLAARQPRLLARYTLVAARHVPTAADLAVALLRAAPTGGGRGYAPRVHGPRAGARSHKTARGGRIGAVTRGPAPAARGRGAHAVTGGARLAAHHSRHPRSRRHPGRS